MFPLSVVRYVFYEIVVIIVPQIVVLILHKPGRAVGVFLAVASVYGFRHKQLDGSEDGNADEHSEGALEISSGGDGKEHLECRKSGGVAKKFGADNIVVDLLYNDNVNKKPESLYGAYKKHDEHRRYRSYERADIGYHVRYADDNAYYYGVWYSEYGHSYKAHNAKHKGVKKFSEDKVLENDVDPLHILYETIRRSCLKHGVAELFAVGGYGFLCGKHIETDDYSDNEVYYRHNNVHGVVEKIHNIVAVHMLLDEGRDIGKLLLKGISKGCNGAYDGLPCVLVKAGKHFGKALYQTVQIGRKGLEKSPEAVGDSGHHIDHKPYEAAYENGVCNKDRQVSQRLRTGRQPVRVRAYEFLKEIYKGRKEKGDKESVYKSNEYIGNFIDKCSHGAKKRTYVVQKAHKQYAGGKHRETVKRYFRILFIQLDFFQVKLTSVRFCGIHSDFYAEVPFFDEYSNT